jgi:nucleoside-diphosphate-sugar epimerase
MKNRGDVRLLITGASGFIGTNAVDFAIANDMAVVNFDIRPPRKASHQEYWKRVDIRERSSLCSAVEEFGPTHILHLAATTGMDIDNIEYFSANTIGVQNLIDSTFNVPTLQKTIFTSSLLVCRNGYIPASDTDYCPPNLYGESKVIGEQMVRSNPPKGQWTIVRPTSIWGPWFEYSYATFFRMIDRGFYIHPGKSPIVKPLGFVDNTVFMMTKLLFSELESSHGQTYYLADYPEHSIQEWGDLIQKNMGTRKIPAMPIAVMRAIASAGDLCKKAGWADPPLTNFRLSNMLMGAHYPIEKIQQLAGPLPYSMENGVRRTIQWMHEQGQIRHSVTPQ